MTTDERGAMVIRLTALLSSSVLFFYVEQQVAGWITLCAALLVLVLELIADDA